MLNQRYTSYVFFFLFFLIGFSAAAQQDIVAYAGNNGAERFNTVLQLSNGTYLVGGSASNLNWVDAAVPRTRLGNAGGIKNDLRTSDKTGFILHISADLKTILRVVHFSSGVVEDIRHIKTNTIPGAATGSIFISGTIEHTSQPGRTGGYFLARLNNNFLGGTPNALTWSYNVWATGLHKSRQPWDVGADSKIVYATGQPNGTDWSGIKRLKADGSGNDIVTDWTTHAGTNTLDGSAALGEWTPAFSNASVSPLESMVNLKLGKCSLRSWNKTDFNDIYSDENGTTKKGRWPLDFFYQDSCNVAFPGSTQSMPGYTNYASGANPTAYVGGIAVDKQNNDIYFGASFQSVTGSGLPDVEPFIVAYTSSGAKKWWARLYQETAAQSPPDQYIDGLSIDYSQPGSLKSVLVLGRQHGNTSKSLWAGNAINNNSLHPFGTSTFNQQFTGANNNIHVSWLGKYRTSNGDLLYSTYIAGFQGSSAVGGIGTVAEAPTWPNHNTGFPDLSDTRTEIDVKTDELGKVYVLLKAKGFTTTKNAYQLQAPPPLAAGKRDVIGDYIVVYEPDLKKLVYSSLLTGEWNRNEPDASKGSLGGANTDLVGCFPSKNAVTIVGFHHDQNRDAIADANSIPFHYQRSVLGTAVPAFTPTWGKNTLQVGDGETAILARLTFAKEIRADFKVNPAGGNCINTPSQFTDLSYSSGTITQRTWNFGTSATPANSTATNPVVQWSTQGQKTVSLTVQDNNGNTDTKTITYFVDAVSTAAFTVAAGSSYGPAPASMTFNGPVQAGLVYLWEITDPISGLVSTYSTANPNHIFPTGGTPGVSYPVKLTVTKGTCTATTTQNIVIKGGAGPLVPDYTINGSATPAKGCVGQIVTFQQTDIKNATTWSWFFGAGASVTSATTQGPHQIYYTSPGIKTTTLTVGNGEITATYNIPYEVLGGANAAFTYSGSTASAPTNMNFNSVERNSSYCYEWVFEGTGMTANGRDANNIWFSAPGEYSVGLKVKAGSCNSTSCESITYQRIVIGNPADIKANFSFGPAQGSCVNNKVTIREMSTSGQDISRSTFQWNFGKDAVPATSNKYRPDPVYWTTPGQKVVTLNVDGKSIKSQIYEVSSYPSADFSIDADKSTCTGALPYKLTFNPTAAGGNIYQWDFDYAANPGVNTSTSSHPTDIVFTDKRAYTVQLTTINNGCRSVSAKNILIADNVCELPSISAGISIQPSRKGCASTEYVIRSTSVGNIASTGYVWTLPAGSVPATFSGAGPQTVTGLVPGSIITLLVTDLGGNQDKVSIKVP